MSFTPSLSYIENVFITIVPDFVILGLLGLYVIISKKKKSWSALQFLRLEKKLKKGKQIIFLLLSDALIIGMLILDVNLMTLCLGVIFVFKTLCFQKNYIRLYRLAWVICLGVSLAFVFIQLSNLWDLSDYSFLIDQLAKLGNDPQEKDLLRQVSTPYNVFLLDHTTKDYLTANPSVIADYQDMKQFDPKM